MNPVHEAVFPPAPIRREEALRYAMQPRRAGAPDIPQMEACIRMAEGRITCRAVWREFPVSWEKERLDLGFARTASAGLMRHLKGCGRVILFAATAGMDMDRLIRRAGAVSALHGLCMHAVGAAIIEEACDRLCAQLADEYPEALLRPRFSPGYGDLPLAMQTDVFRALDCEKRLGLTLTDTLLMQPSKSVTALVGIAEKG